eukprot:TRINITY_DN8425_c0_g1_i1.p1 TRINITY_DN8425_c0_g1~~TRINITY_DN8425_c0_g1_i1.p1  ORF type:complete len:151 (+),score=34.93 TRINITY_DN8425_c0_g1_i1:39-455(+)
MSKKIAINSNIPSYINDCIRESVWIDISNTDFTKEFTFIWDEHVQGFSQKRKTEKDKNVEWRQRLRENNQKTKVSQDDLQMMQKRARQNYKKAKQMKGTGMVQKAGIVKNQRVVGPGTKRPVVKRNAICGPNFNKPVE